MRNEALAKVISFAPRARTMVGPPWTTAELGELFRVSHVLRQSGMSVGTDLGLSDEGDPWFVFYNLQTEDVIAHFARINGGIIVHGLLSDGIVSGNDLHGVMRRLPSIQALDDRQKSQNDRTVVLHPFMLLVAFLAASFLASEESQAAAPAEKRDQLAGEGHSVREKQVKAKADWIERVIALLDSKTKERSEGTPAELSSASRKIALEDSFQPTLALVMLATAISYAQKEILSSENLVENNLDLALKPVRDAPPAVADAVTPPLDSMEANTQATDLAAQAVSNASHSKAPSPADTANTSFNAVNAAVLNPEKDAMARLPSPLSLPESAPPASLPSNTEKPASSPSSQDSFLVLETSEAPTPRIETPRAAKPESAASSAETGTASAASINITYEGKTLHLHRISSDMRQVDAVLGKSELKGEKDPALESSSKPVFIEKPVLVDLSQSDPGSSAEVRWVTLTDAREHVLIGNGDTRIKNFSLGVDCLIFEDPLLFKKLPEVYFTSAGDVIFNFSETVRVTLLGILEPSHIHLSADNLQGA